jgi:hypothetical protein
LVSSQFGSGWRGEAGERRCSRKTRVRQSASKSVQESACRWLINLSSDYLQSQGRQLRLFPGMLVNAEIHLGTRTVLEYSLSPVQKVA